MRLEELKIKDSDINEYGIVAAPDRLVGNAQENKKVFDRLIRECVGERFNALIDLLGGEGGGSGSYTLPIAGANTLGGIKVGPGLAISAAGVLYVTDMVEELPNGDEVSY